LEIIGGKGNKRRVTKLSPAALAHFKTLAREKELIFRTPDGKPLTKVRWDFQHYRRQAAAKAKRDDRPFVGFRFHDLRHLHAVEALRGGMESMP
jgi:integrase/recombinase XerD